MLSKTIKFIDFNGEEAEEKHYFNITEAEAVRLDVKFGVGGLVKYIENIDVQEKPEEIMTLFEEILTMAYGKKSPDGRKFLKSKEATEEFKQTAAYSSLFVSLIRDAEYAATFFQRVLSKTAIPTKEETSSPNGVSK